MTLLHCLLLLAQVREIAPPPRPVGADRATLSGSVPAGEATGEEIPLSLDEAVRRGLEHNLARLLSDDAVRSARGARWEALADLLPHLSGRVSATRQKINLEAFGFTGFPGVPSTLVGPFNVFDARVAVTESLVDLEAFHKTKARSESLAAARFSYQDTRDLVVLVCGNLYMAAVSEASRIDASRAQLETAQALFRLASDRKQAGLVPAVDVLRAEVEMEARQQQLIVAENRAARAKLNLARAVGLPLGQRFVLTDPMPAAGPVLPDLDGALLAAYRDRSDWKAAAARVRAAEASRRSAIGEALPKLELQADYGAIGATVGGAHATYSFGAAVRVPLFEGGSAIGKEIQASATLDAERAGLEDLRGRIDYEVRTAVLDLQAASERVTVASRALGLANDQLRQAQDRFAAGIANNIDLVQAQQAVAEATDSQIAAVYDQNTAQAALARAVGAGEAEFHQRVRGER
jgi:outer membrane protein TolC